MLERESHATEKAATETRCCSSGKRDKTSDASSSGYKDQEYVGAENATIYGEGEGHSAKAAVTEKANRYIREETDEAQASAWADEIQESESASTVRCAIDVSCSSGDPCD